MFPASPTSLFRPIGQPEERVPSLGPLHDEATMASAARAEIWTMMRIGGFDEAVVRAVLFVLARERNSAGRMAAALDDLFGRLLHLSHESFERIVHDQAAVLKLDAEVAIESLPALLPEDRRSGTKLLRYVGAAVTPTVADVAVRSRLERLGRIVCLGEEALER